MGLTFSLDWELRWNLRPDISDLTTIPKIVKCQDDSIGRGALCCRIHMHPSVPLCILNKWAVLIGGGE